MVQIALDDPPPSEQPAAPAKPAGQPELDTTRCSCKLFLASVSPANLPVQAGGIALNIVAISGLLQLLANDLRYEFLAPLFEAIEVALFVCSLSLQCIMFLRAGTIIRQGGKCDLLLRQELASRRMSAGWAALILCHQITWARLHPYIWTALRQVLLFFVVVRA